MLFRSMVPFFGYKALENGASAALTLSTETGIYSLLPAFALALVAVVAVSLITKVDKAKVEELFKKVESTTVDSIAAKAE